MFKILIAAIILIVLGTLIAGLSFFNNPKVEKPATVNKTVEQKEVPAGNPSALAQAIEEVISTPLPLNADGSNLVEHVSLLEKTIQVLQKRVDNLEKLNKITNSTASSSASPTISKKAPVYISLGSETSATSQTYVSQDGFGASLDPAEFEGYTSIQLEVFLKVPALVGTAYARLYNSTDSKEVSSSEISTKVGDYTLLTSGNFTLPAGKKSYFLQLKSTESQAVYAKNPRLKINF